MLAKIMAVILFLICVATGYSDSGSNYQTFARGINITTNVLKFTDSNLTNSGIKFADGTFMYTLPICPSNTSTNIFQLITTNIVTNIQFTATNKVYFTNNTVATHYCLEKGYVFIDRTNFIKWPVDQWAHFRLYSSTSYTYEATSAEYMEKRMSAQRVGTTAVSIGTKNITVDDASVFNVDDPVVICYTNGNYQLNKITDKISNTLYFQDGTTIDIPANSTNNTVNSVFMLGNLNLYDTTGATNLYGSFEFDTSNVYTGRVKFIYQVRN